MPRYAATTEVSSYRSREEIERTLARYGATEFIYGWRQEMAVVGFQMQGRQIRFTLPMPDRNDRRFTHTPAQGYLRSEKAATDAYEQAVRQRWRALALVVKAKLEAVESQITTFEEEFLAHIVIEGGDTIGERLIPEIDAIYRTGNLPALMPGPTRAILLPAKT